MKDLKRGLRRARTQAIVTTRMNNGYYGKTLHPSKEHDCVFTSVDKGLLRSSPQICSFACCGNARRWFGDSLKELSDKETLKKWGT